MNATPSPPPRRSRASQPLHIGLLVYQLAAAIIGLFLVVRAVPEMRRVLSENIPWDLNIDRLTARAYVEGYSPYTPEGAIRSGAVASGPSGNGHPPTTSFWVLPIASLEQAPATIVMATVTLMLLFIELIAVLRALGCPAAFATAWLALGYVFDSPFMLYHLSLGQWSGVIGFFYAVAWWASREGQDGMAGIALGSACTLKLFPGVVLLFFLVTRRWRVLAGAAGTYLVIAAIMTARFGLHSWPRFLSQQSAIANQWMSDIQNQSLHGIVQRCFTPVCVPHGPVIRSAMILSSVLAASLIGVSLWWARRIPRGHLPFDLTYALFVVLSVVTSQWTWEHYAVIYVLPIAILTSAAVRAAISGVGRWRAVFVLGVLAAIVAGWRIGNATKMTLQSSVQSGHLADHFQLHLFDVLNWGPGVILLVVLMASVGRLPLFPATSPRERDDGAREGFGQQGKRA